jgi:hypothetical protein
MLNAEAIDLHLDQNAGALDSAHRTATAGTAKLNPTQAIQAVCTGYRAVKPILQLVMGFPFFRQSWKDAVGKFTGVLDTLCP